MVGSGFDGGDAQLLMELFHQFGGEVGPLVSQDLIWDSHSGK